MFNIFEQPVLFFVAALISLIYLYISTLERKFYWLSLLILICLAFLNLFLKEQFFFFSPKTITILEILLPIAAAGLSIWLIISIIRLHDRSSLIWLLPLILTIAGFGIDWLVKTDMEKIKLTINTARRAVEQQDLKLFSSVISDKYKDSFHPDKQALLGHFGSYFAQPLCDSVKWPSKKIDIKQDTATVDAVFFLTFNQNSFVVREYIYTTASVALKIFLNKEADRRWKIADVEITEVNNQPFVWSAVGR
jgi:hypothetical protein